MGKKRKIQGPNGLVDATEVGFRPTGEHWNEYLLDDGTVAAIKLVVTKAYRVDGQVDHEGNPVYILSSTNIITVSVPEGSDQSK